MKHLLTGALALSVGFLASCSDSSSSTSSGPDGGYKPSNPVELSQCEAIDDAELNAKIENAVTSLSEFVFAAKSDPSDLAAMQLQTQNAKSLFSSALENYPASCEAQLGLALAQVADLVSNPEASTIYNTLVNGTDAQKFNLFNIDNVSDPENFLKKTVGGELITTRVQDIVVNSALPVVDSAIAMFDNVLSYDYSFSVSTEDIEVSIGRSELLFSLGTLRTLRAALVVAASYDLDASNGGSYNWVTTIAQETASAGDSISADLEKAFDHAASLIGQKSSFLSVKDSWKSVYKTVPAILDSAAENFHDGLEYLLNGNSNSSLAMLVGDGEDADISTADIENAIQAVDSVRKVLSSTVEIEIAGTPVKVNVAKFFGITDGLLKYLPYHEVMPLEHWVESFYNPDDKYVDWIAAENFESYADESEYGFKIYAGHEILSYAQKNIDAEISYVYFDYKMREAYFETPEDEIYALVSWNGCAYQLTLEDSETPYAGKLTNSCKVENGTTLFKVSDKDAPVDFVHFKDKSGHLTATYADIEWNSYEMDRETWLEYLEGVIVFPDLTFGGVFPEMDQRTLIGLLFN